MTPGRPSVPTAADVVENVALVDQYGAVVGTAPRHVVRRDNLLHAATAVLVRSATRIYLHRRSAGKDWAPGYHDCAAGGMMRDGEPPGEAALRELEEELGITGTRLHPLGTSLYEDDTTRCFEHCYETTWDGPVRHLDAEVSEGRWVDLAELRELLTSPGFRFVPDTRHLLARLAREDRGDYGLLRPDRGESARSAAASEELLSQEQHDQHQHDDQNPLNH